MDLKDLERAARAQGWEVGRTKKGHPRFVPPDPTGEIVVTSGTPSDHRFLKNLLADLKRQGFIWPWTPQRKRGEP